MTTTDAETFTSLGISSSTKANIPTPQTSCAMIGELELDVAVGNDDRRSHGCGLRDVLETLVGLRPGQAVWGTEPLDLGACCHRRSKAVPEATDEHGEVMGTPRGLGWSSVQGDSPGWGGIMPPRSCPSTASRRSTTT